MKKIYKAVFLCSLGLGLVLANCSTTGEGRSNNSSEGEVSSIPERYWDLTVAEYLPNMSGIVVEGFRVIINGVNNVGSYSPPLFVVDGNPKGHDFSDVAYISMRDVKNIEIMKGPRTSVYGTQGGGGVILIETRSR